MGRRRRRRRRCRLQTRRRFPSPFFRLRLLPEMPVLPSVPVDFRRIRQPGTGPRVPVVAAELHPGLDRRRRRRRRRDAGNVSFEAHHEKVSPFSLSRFFLLLERRIILTFVSIIWHHPTSSPRKGFFSMPWRDKRLNNRPNLFFPPSFASQTKAGFFSFSYPRSLSVSRSTSTRRRRRLFLSFFFFLLLLLLQLLRLLRTSFCHEKKKVEEEKEEKSSIFSLLEEKNLQSVGLCFFLFFYIFQHHIFLLLVGPENRKEKK